MVYLEKGQKLYDNPGMVMYDQTGYYNDGDSVICASIGSPNEPVCRYEAKFVAYGGQVYSTSDEDALMAEILKIDPKSLFGKDSKQVAVDKAIDAIVPQESGDLDSKPKAEVIIPENTETSTSTPTTTPQTNVTPTPTQTTTPTPTITQDPVQTPTSTSTPTTTPEIILPENTPSASTTPEILLPDTNATSTESMSTTTPNMITPDPVVDIPTIEPVIPNDTSTTSPEISSSTESVINE